MAKHKQVGPQRKNLLVIEDATVRSMLQDPRVMEQLPCLQQSQRQLNSIKKGKANCNRCKQEKSRIVSDAMTAAKNCIRGLRGEKLNKLKAVLNARQLRVHAKNARGQRIEVTL